MKKIISAFIFGFGLLITQGASAAKLHLDDLQDGSAAGYSKVVSDSTFVDAGSTGVVAWILKTSTNTGVNELGTGSADNSNVWINSIKVYDSGNHLVASAFATVIDSVQKLKLGFHLSTITQPYVVKVAYHALAGGDLHAVTLTASAVPVPAAVWLFGSALLGLVGVSRRKASANGLTA